MTKGDLLKLLSDLPDEVPIVLDAEGGIDLARSVCLVEIRKTARGWSGTPVGNFRVVTDEDECTGAAMPAILISLEG